MKTQLRVWFKDSRHEGRYTQIEIEGSYADFRARLAAGEMISADRVVYERDENGHFFVTDRFPCDFTRGGIERVEENLIWMAGEAA